MKFSRNWLADLVAELDTPAKDLMGLITLKIAECDGVEPFGSHFAQVRAALVLSVEALPNSHNSKALVDAGVLGTHTVVCGASNCRPGVLTAWAPPGTVLGDRTIGKAVIEGVESEGMLASGAELGVNRDHSGIVELAAGAPGAAIEGLSPDYVIEIDNKSLNHRPDLWGHHGMAREVAAVLGKTLRDPVRLHLLPAGPSPINVEIADHSLSPRYSGLWIENITVGPSPLWLQYRLEAIGLNSINNVVDVTNWVMAELAQPMHAFDADKLRGHTIFVRPARQGETCMALNGETYSLDPSNIVIADRESAVAIGGVIGGLESAITEQTQRVVLESANFQASSIRKTSGKLKLRTDASMRFEKAQDPVNTVRGLSRAVELLQLVSPGIRIVGGVADNYRPAALREPIRLPMDWLQRKLGRSIDAGEVRGILERLSFSVDEESRAMFHVHVPSWRATKDVAIKDDLLEEVGRTVGYDTIPTTAPLVATLPPPQDPVRRFHDDIRTAAAAQGFTEVQNYSFVSDEEVRVLGLDPDTHIRVANPISVEQSLLRRTLLHGLLRNIAVNAKHCDTFRLFEIGHEIHPRTAGELPDEVPHLAAVIWHRTQDGGIQELIHRAGCLVAGIEIRPAAPVAWEHPARAAQVIRRGECIGRVFELHPSFGPGRSAILDLDLHKVFELRDPTVRYQPLRRYPTAAFDLSVVAAPRDLAGDIGRRLERLAAGDLVSIEFLRVYSGPPLPPDRKSVSWRLTVGAADRTLSSEEVNAIRDRIIAGMRDAGFELRV